MLAAMAALGALGGMAEAQSGVVTSGARGAWVQGAGVFAGRARGEGRERGGALECADRHGGDGGGGGDALLGCARGTPAVAPHKILHAELHAVVEGTVELWVDGVATRATAGSVLYVPYGTTHFIKNVGDGPARYFVFQVGGDTKKS